MDKRIRAVTAALGFALGSLCWLAAPAGAASAALGAGAGAVKDAASEQAAVQQVRWVRRCWWDRRGFRHCRRVWRPGYFYGAPYYRPRVGRYWGGPRRYFRGGRYVHPRAFHGRRFHGGSFRGHGFRAHRGRMGRR